MRKTLTFICVFLPISLLWRRNFHTFSSLSAKMMRHNVLVYLACFLCLVSCASALTVIGIDFGSEYIKVALVKPGTPFHIVTDETSKRKIPAMIAFDEGERAFGTNAKGLAIRKSKQTYMWAHRLLGQSIDSPYVEALKNRGLPWEIVEVRVHVYM